MGSRCHLHFLLWLNYTGSFRMYSLLQQCMGCMGGKASSLDCCNCSGASELMLCATFTSGLFSIFVYLWCLSCAWLCLCVTKGTLYCGVTCHCSATDAMTWEHECMNGHRGYCKWHPIFIFFIFLFFLEVAFNFDKGGALFITFLSSVGGPFLESK